MRNRIAICAGAVLLALAPLARGQEPGAMKGPETETPPGKRLRVEFKETRQKSETATAARSYVLLLHADSDSASVFVGPVVAMTTSDQGTLTTQFKNAGVNAQVSAATLPGGEYRLQVEFEDSAPLGSGGGVTGIRAADNPILSVVKSRSTLRLREGQTVVLASAVDPVTGEVVRVDVTLAAAPEPSPVPARAGASSRLRARMLLVRRQGGTIVAQRPYSVVVDPAGAMAEAFGGSQLPVQTIVQGTPTVMLKDLGAGLQVGAERKGDGRYRVKVRFSDGVLASAEGTPRMHVFESESLLFLGEGETVKVASAVDPRSGEVVEAELSLEGER
jgi:hypothetical protein